MNFLNKIELYHSIIVFSLCDIRTSSSSPVLEMTKDKGKKKKKKRLRSTYAQNEERK